MGVLRRILAVGLFGALVFGAGTGIASIASADIEASTGVNVQEGDNEASSDQDGEANSGDAITGQVVGGVVSGDARVDATNRTVDSSAESGDADGSNSATQFVGNNFERTACPPTTTGQVVAADCPQSADAGFIGEAADIEGDITAVIIQEGDNDGSIDQSATANTGDAAAGQIIGFVGAGVTDIVASNDSEDSDAKSGDADAHNTVESAEVGNLVTEAECLDCPLPTDIIVGSASAAIIQEGDNDQSIDQSADATTGDALAGAQVIGAVNSSTGRTSIDATNRSRDADSQSGDADADNFVGLAASGNAALGVSPECCGLTADITGDSINAVIVHEGDNDQTIDQSADASTGDALAGSQVIGSVDTGSSEIVASNDSVDANAESGDAESANTVEDAETGNLVIFSAACLECPTSDATFVQDISAESLNGVNIHEGDNDQSIDQLADASSGDALAGSQVIGSVTGLGGDTSIDATNRSRDAEAESGDADAENNIGLAASGDAALDVPLDDPTADIGGGDVNGVNIHEGDNDQTLDQTAEATTGDALAGSQVTGVVSGGRTSVVVSNDGVDTDVTTGDASFRNSVERSETGDIVQFGGECDLCPLPDLSSNQAKAQNSAIILVALAALAYSRRRARHADGARRRVA